MCCVRGWHLSAAYVSKHEHTYEHMLICPYSYMLVLYVRRGEGSGCQGENASETQRWPLHRQRGLRPSDSPLRWSLPHLSQRRPPPQILLAERAFFWGVGGACACKEKEDGVGGGRKADARCVGVVMALRGPWDSQCRCRCNEWRCDGAQGFLG